MRTTALSSSSRPHGCGRDHPVREPSGSGYRDRPQRAASMIRAGGLYVGVTLLDETRELGARGLAKPHPDFFAKVLAFAPGDPAQILYVGDHRDNDLLPAHAAGMRTALIRRGPWGYLWADDPTVVKTADWIINSLTELPDL